MRRLMIALAMLIVSGIAMAQDVTTFMGIPIDGTEEAMARKLERKGFKQVEGESDNILTGTFLNRDVWIFFKSSYGKLWRVSVYFDSFEKEYIVYEYNRILDVFNRNDRYVAVEDNKHIDYDTFEQEIGYDNEGCKARFFQLDKGKINGDKIVWFSIWRRKSGQFCVVLRFDNYCNLNDGDDDL